MTAPNPAVGAQPGDRFTDLDGGTWVRMAPLSRAPWLEIVEGKVLADRTWRARCHPCGQAVARMVGDELRPIDSWTTRNRETADTRAEAFNRGIQGIPATPYVVVSRVEQPWLPEVSS